MILTWLWQYTHQKSILPRLTLCLILVKKKYMARPGFEPSISRSEVDRANHYVLHRSLVWNLANLFMILTLWWDKKWVLAWLSFGECTARVKLELTDFKCILHLQVVEMNPAEAMAANLARFHPYSLSPYFTGVFLTFRNLSWPRVFIVNFHKNKIRIRWIALKSFLNKFRHFPSNYDICQLLTYIISFWV